MTDPVEISRSASCRAYLKRGVDAWREFRHLVDLLCEDSALGEAISLNRCYPHRQLRCEPMADPYSLFDYLPPDCVAVLLDGGHTNGMSWKCWMLPRNSVLFVVIENLVGRIHRQPCIEPDADLTARFLYREEARHAIMDSAHRMTAVGAHGSLTLVKRDTDQARLSVRKMNPGLVLSLPPETEALFVDGGSLTKQAYWKYIYHPRQEVGFWLEEPEILQNL